MRHTESSLNPQEKRLIGQSLTPIVGLFLYSFTQIDLELTLNRLPLWQTIQHGFQYIGYFNRPLSTLLFLIIITSLTFVYVYFLQLAFAKKLRMRTVWIFLFITTPLLTISYNAFSYDLFNYIFDAKILTYYHLNPYLHRARDFPSDPMLHFMRWIHRTYPYGPVWLGVTAPLSFLGHNIFIVTYALFKCMIAGSYLLTSYFISQTVRMLKPEREVVSVVFFALNPLVLIESLVSAHNDIVMLAFLMMGLYLLIKRSYVLSILLYIFSVGTKFATGFIAPVIFIMYFLSWRERKIPWDILFIIGSGLMGVAVLAATKNSGNFQPWYLLYILIFASLVPTQYYVRIPAIVLSIGALLTYAPFLYNGDYGIWTQVMTKCILASTVVLAVLTPFVWKIVVKKK